MNILITGSSGYIGSRLVIRAQERSHSITAASPEPVSGVQGWVRFDLGEKPSFMSLKPVDAVVHLAANTSSKDISEVDEIAAADELIAAVSEYGARFVFISSQTAREDAPTSYGRIKWNIEQEVLKAGGVVVRLGQVYGGPEKGLFGTLTGIVRKSPVLPAFMPPVTVQPIHLDDCVTGILRLVEQKNIQSGTYCLASSEPVAFTCFLRSIARHRLRKYRLFIPLPVFLVRAVSKLMGANLRVKTGLDRLNSLLALPAMDTCDDLKAIGLELRSLRSGMNRSGSDRRRRLIQEGNALLKYIMKEKPRSETVRRYVRMIEQLQAGLPLDLRSAYCRWPALLALLDCHGGNNSQQEEMLEWRIDAATLIAEASKRGALRFLGTSRPSMRITAFAKIMAAAFSELIWRLIRLLVPSSLLRLS